ncbi:MAG: DUF4150 domain-containing protein [Enhygromyxa sp.]
MTKVYANGRTVLHKGDGLTQTSGPPDVCKTPSPSGPVPVAYPNAARDRDLAKGAKSVKIEGNPVALASSNIRTSTGDEAGTAGGGLMSAKTKGKLTFGSSSLDVMVEGKGVVRFGDVTQHNGNTYNTVLAAAGGTGAAYGDDPLDLEDCSICGEAKEKHRIGPADDIVEKALKLRKALKDGPFAKAFVRGGNSPTPNRPLKPGLALGVLSCQCDGVKQYAGIGGTAYVDGNYLAAAEIFIAEAAKLGLIGVVNPPAPPPLSGLHPPVGNGGFGGIAGSQWDDTLKRLGELNKKWSKNAALTCAAPKMIQKCLEDGHKPGTLIEMWVGFRDSSTVTIPRILTVAMDHSVDPPGRKTEWADNMVYEDGDDIPSCITCQVTCTGMLCNTGKPPCP